MPGSVPSRVSRRSLFQIAAGVTAGRARGLAQPSPSGAATLERLERAQGDPNRRILLRGGVVLSLDPKVGDFEKADVLVEGKKISALGPNLDAGRSALIVDASDHIVMPGFVDTHHHQYETLLRSILSDGNLGLTADSPTNYLSTIQGILTPAYRPEDSYISELVASLNQINAGVTTTVDTSQVSHTPAHTDACIAGLKESGRRAVFAYSSGQGPASQFPQDLTRLSRQYFSSRDQLLTLALHTGLNADHWKLARSLGAAIVMHLINGDLQAMKNAGLLGPDTEYIHCTQINEAAWRLIADSGGHVSIAPAIEMQMRHGMPPIQAALDHAIRPSLSVDVECNMTADMFSIMRSAFTLQRALVNQRALAGEKNLPRLLTWPRSAGDGNCRRRTNRSPRCQNRNAHSRQRGGYPHARYRSDQCVPHEQRARYDRDPNGHQQRGKCFHCGKGDEVAGQAGGRRLAPDPRDHRAGLRRRPGACPLFS